MIQSGTIHYDANTPGWAFLTPGKKEFTSPDLKFNPSFPTVSNVVVCLAGIDAQQTMPEVGGLLYRSF